MLSYIIPVPAYTARSAPPDSGSVPSILEVLLPKVMLAIIVGIS